MNKGLNFLLFVVFLLCAGSLAGNIYLVFYGTQRASSYDREISSLKAEIEMQRNQKNQIRDLWENSTYDNDSLVSKQVSLTSEIKSLEFELTRTIRFVSGKPQLVETANMESYQQAIKNIQNAQTSLDAEAKISQENKDKAKSSIDSLYVQAGEDQNNRANPRDGIRN